ALYLYQHGVTWWLDTSEEEAHDQRNKRFKVTDTWQEYFDQAQHILTGEYHDFSRGLAPAFTLGSLVEGLLGQPKNSEKRAITNRLKDLLTANGFVQIRKGKAQSRVYVPKEKANENIWRVASQTDVLNLAMTCGHRIEPAKSDSFSEPANVYMQ